MTRVLHTGDTHIGYRQYHSPERRADFLAAFRRVVEDAIEGDVDAVVHAGDLFHDRQPALADIHGTIEVLRDLRDAGVPLFAVVGNHERTRGRQWLDLFETLGLATRLDREPRVVGDVALYGLDFVPRSRRDALEYDFAPHDADHAALVVHGLFEPFAHADWETETVLESATVDFDAMLLGDNHDPGVETVAGTWVTYCGSTERTDATEREARGYNLVTFDGEVTVARRGIETRPFVPVDLELAPGEGTDRVRDRLREEALEDAIVVVTITGDGEPVSPADVETFAADRGALVARVSDRREFEAAEVPEVRFADPDQAVRERLRELGLSDAAVGIDETVRETDTIADTNVRNEVRARVAELLEDDPEAFDPPPADGPTTGEPSGEPSSEPASEHADGTAADASTADGSTAAGDDAAAETASADPQTETDAADPGNGPDAAATAEARASAAGAAEPDDAEPERAADDQVTMEEYL